MKTWGDLFNARQKLSLLSIVQAAATCVSEDAELGRLLACAFDRVAMSNMSCTRWNAIGEKMQHTFGRQALPIVWDFAEVVPIADAPGNWRSGYELVRDVVGAVPKVDSLANVQIADACESPLPDASAAIWFTDPPYYDAVPYSDLSDFFFVWLKRFLPTDSLSRDPFDPQNDLTQKQREAVQDETKQWKGHDKDQGAFEHMMASAFSEGTRVLKDDGAGCVVFAHKTTEGWEALLSGMVRGGQVITASWPIVTEMSTRLRARDSAALATSVHLVCRPRDEGAGIGDWADIIRELPRRIANWMERLSGEGIRGADLVFACIGPALELFSRYARVETPDGEEVGLAANDEARGEPARRGFLSYVWEVVGRAALNQVLGSAESKARNGAAGALEEDARLTALFLWTLQATDAAANGNGGGRKKSPRSGAVPPFGSAQGRRGEGEEEPDADEEGDEDAAEDGGATKGRRKSGLTLIFDVARRFAQPLGIHLDAWEGRIIETSKGVVRLLPVRERARQFFGEEGASAIVRRFESSRKVSPQTMFDFMAERAAAPEVKGRGRRKKKTAGGASPEDLHTRREATTLDRVHAAMLLQSSGATNALRALLEAETQRGPDFLRLANALSALYPRDSEEKRLLDAMLLAAPR